MSELNYIFLLNRETTKLFQKLFIIFLQNQVPIFFKLTNILENPVTIAYLSLHRAHTLQMKCTYIQYIHVYCICIIIHKSVDKEIKTFQSILLTIWNISWYVICILICYYNICILLCYLIKQTWIVVTN